VLQGERERAAANKSLGRFDLSDIPPAPRGVPQVEVTFDTDANGILHVSAKDKATGREQSIVIKASSGLKDDEIERMVRDAEVHAEEDRKFHELVDVRNQAENLIHATEKTLRDLGDKVTGTERHDIENAISDLRDAAKGDNQDVIVSRTQKLGEVSSKLAERVYAQAGGQTGPEGTGGAEQGAGEGGKRTAEEGVVDAEFEEVKDK
jgi:molecular chaperone DnaK